MSAAGTGSALSFAVTGRIGDLSAQQLARLVERGLEPTPELTTRVAQVIEQVRRDGDVALRRSALEFDGATLHAVEVPAETCRAALRDLDPAVVEALRGARRATEVFHREQIPAAQEVEVVPGVRLGRRPDPLDRVGVYAPGGRAAYPSSVLMGVVPARVAGVREIVVCSPARPNGLPAAPVLAACALAGADRVFAAGGAAAIAALAYGTATIPRVDRVVGPGNAYVTEAKRQLSNVVGTDSPAGPSEVLVIADSGADANIVAAELTAQAEHDPDAACVLVTTHPPLADQVAAVLRATVPRQPRRDIVQQSFARHGALLVAEDIDEALAFTARYAPEHLVLLCAEPRSLLARVRSAGTVFLGSGSSVAFGDYTTGANHVLPTAGAARTYSGLSTLDFIRWTTWQEVDAAAAARLAAPTAVLAEAEGLPAHASAARLRERDDDPHTERPRGQVKLRRAYAEVRPYDPGRAPCAVDLSDNTNLFGPAPSAAAILEAPPPARTARYPSVHATELKRALAEVHGVSEACVTTGCGSDDVIDSAVRAFCEPGDTLAFPAPTFGVVPQFARMNAVRAHAVPLLSAFRLDADALLACGARLIYLCRPNNPTGTLFERVAVECVVENAAGVVLIDEAYAEYAGADLIRYAVGSGRAVVLRTMSKAYGLAGLRVGCAIGPERLIAEIEKSRGPYKLGGSAEAAATAALRQDGAWVSEHVACVRENRERLRAELERRGFAPIPSHANFLLVPVPDAASKAARLRRLGVQVRPFVALPGAGDAIRVTIGPWSMLEAFLDCLDQVRR